MPRNKQTNEFEAIFDALSQEDQDTVVGEFYGYFN